MRVAAVQLDIAWENPAENYRRAERRIQESAALGAQLVVLPEIFAYGFSMRSELVAEAPGGPTETFLSEIAAGLGIHLIAGVALVLDGLLPHNCAVHIAPDGTVQRYQKLHPFTFAKEHEHYAAGNAVHTWAIGDLRITPMVCYDLRFPEPFRIAADDTHLYVVIANWPDRRRAAWQTLLRARAIENQAFVVGVNRVGDGDGLHYAGDSVILSPWGEPLAAAAEQETVLLADLDRALVAGVRGAISSLKDRRKTYHRA